MEVYDDQPTKVSDLPKIRTNVQDYLDWLRQNFSDVKLLEPLRELFKDEVRVVGAQLGLPREVV